MRSLSLSPCKHYALGQDRKGTDNLFVYNRYTLKCFLWEIITPSKFDCVEMCMDNCIADQISIERERKYGHYF